MINLKCQILVAGNGEENNYQIKNSDRRHFKTVTKQNRDFELNPIHFDRPSGN